LQQQVVPYDRWGAVILEDHLRGCVSKAIQNKDNETEMISQVVDIFNKFGK
jgi:DNA-binding FrmR family transcriptional regulator